MSFSAPPLYFLLFICLGNQFVNASNCTDCVASGKTWCVTVNECGFTPCLTPVSKSLNCPELPDKAHAYDDTFVRSKVLVTTAAAFNDNPQKCFKNSMPTMKLSKTFSVNCSESGPQTNCFGYTAFDTTQKVVVMSFRGTDGNVQLVDEMLSFFTGKKPFFDDAGHIFTYFYDAFFFLWNGGLSQEIRTLKYQYPGYELWVNGHSLGGAIASIAASYVVHSGLYDASKVKLVTMGQPRTGDYEYAMWHDRTFPYSFRIVHHRDIVPHIPPQYGVDELFHHRTEIWAFTPFTPVGSSGMCAKCIQRGQVYCPMFDRCGIFPVCLSWIDKLLNCLDTRNTSIPYDDEFVRTKMLALAAAGYSDEPEKCLKKVLPDGQVLNTYTVKCSYETDSLLHITTSWLAYFLDQINWIDYNPPPLISSDCLAFIATDDVAKVIVMSFRGTEGLLQLFEQILQYQRGGKPFYENGHIYEYFFNAFNLIWMGGFEKGAREALAGRTGDDYELWITGYSLGGALASVTSSYIAKLGLFPPSRIKIVTFGQPRTSDYDHAAWHDATFPYSFRVINGRDPVPHIPPKIGPLALFHHGTEVWYPTEMWPLSERKVCAEADGDYCSNRILLWNIMDHIYYFEVDVGEWGKKGCAG